METQTKSIELSTPAAQNLHEELKAERNEDGKPKYGVMISKRQYAEIIGCSLSAVDHYIAKGYGIPSYKKIGHQRNARVLFSLRDVAEYLAAQTVQTA